MAAGAAAALTKAEVPAVAGAEIIAITATVMAAIAMPHATFPVALIFVTLFQVHLL